MLITLLAYAAGIEGFTIFVLYAALAAFAFLVYNEARSRSHRHS